MSTTTPTAPDTVPDRAWHLVTASEAADELAVSIGQGLAEDQVRQRREVSGLNTLPEPNRRSRVMLLVDQVRNPLVLLLLGAAVIAGLVGDVKDAVVILAVVAINSALGFVQESRAENSLESLRQMLAPTCVVRRSGAIAEIPAQDLVPGDVVLLDAGSQVPADGRLLVAEQLICGLVCQCGMARRPRRWFRRGRLVPSRGGCGGACRATRGQADMRGLVTA
jgi:Ca2+-transporting ATPase